MTLEKFNWEFFKYFWASITHFFGYFFLPQSILHEFVKAGESGGLVVAIYKRKVV